MQVVYALCSRIPRHPAYLCTDEWTDIISISNFQTLRSTVNKKWKSPVTKPKLSVTPSFRNMAPEISVYGCRHLPAFAYSELFTMLIILMDISKPSLIQHSFYQMTVHMIAHILLVLGGFPPEQKDTHSVVNRTLPIGKSFKCVSSMKAGTWLCLKLKLLVVFCSRIVRLVILRLQTFCVELRVTKFPVYSSVRVVAYLLVSPSGRLVL